MNLLSCFSLQLIMWVLSNTLFSAIIDARSEPPIPVPSISEQFFVAERIPISQFPVKMEAEPPGTSTMQRIFCLCSLFQTTMYLLWFVHYLLICGLTCLPCLGSQSKLKFETRLKTKVDRFLFLTFLDNTLLLCLVVDNAVQRSSKFESLFASRFNFENLKERSKFSQLYFMGLIFFPPFCLCPV